MVEQRWMPDSHTSSHTRFTRTKLHQALVTASLILLQRLKDRFPTVRGSSGHRLSIPAFMISSKVICDDTYSNKSWTIVAQNMFNLRENNQMEREMCNYLDWELAVEKSMLDSFTVYLESYFDKERDPISISKLDISKISKQMRVASSPMAANTALMIPLPIRYPSVDKGVLLQNICLLARRPVQNSQDYVSTPTPSFSASISPASTAAPSTPPSSEDYSDAIASEDTSPPFQCLATVHDLSLDAHYY